MKFHFRTLKLPIIYRISAIFRQNIVTFNFTRSDSTILIVIYYFETLFFFFRFGGGQNYFVLINKKLEENQSDSF